MAHCQLLLRIAGAPSVLTFCHSSSLNAYLGVDVHHQQPRRADTKIADIEILHADLRWQCSEPRLSYTLFNIVDEWIFFRIAPLSKYT